MDENLDKMQLELIKKRINSDQVGEVKQLLVEKSPRHTRNKSESKEIKESDILKKELYEKYYAKGELFRSNSTVNLPRTKKSKEDVLHTNNLSTIFANPNNNPRPLFLKKLTNNDNVIDYEDEEKPPNGNLKKSNDNSRDSK